MSNTLPKPLRIALWAAALILAGVSILCEILLFVGHVESTVDMAIAIATGTALVACQYLFAALSAHLYRQHRTWSASVVALVTTVLMTVSIAGSTGFLESRFTSDQVATTQQSNAYRIRQQAIDDLTEQHQAITTAAENANTKGNSWYAGQLLEQAQQVNQQRLDLMAQLDTIETPASSSAGALAVAAGPMRWVLWGLLAALIDVCPVLVFAVLGASKNTPKTPSEAKTPPAVKTPAPSKTPASRTPAVRPRNDLKNTESTNPPPSVDAIKQFIKAGKLGKELGLRSAMRRFNTQSNQPFIQAFSELRAEGFLVRAGKGKPYQYAQPLEGSTDD